MSAPLSPELSPESPVELDAARRRALKQQAHHLHPVVSTGNAGLTPAVLAEMDSSLTHHELMKIRLIAEDRDARRAMVDEICRTLKAQLVQQVGFVATLYRDSPEKRRQEKKKLEALKRQEIRAKAKAGAERDARRRKSRAVESRPAPWFGQDSGRENRDSGFDSKRRPGRGRPDFRRTSPR